MVNPKKKSDGPEFAFTKRQVIIFFGIILLAFIVYIVVIAELPTIWFRNVFPTHEMVELIKIEKSLPLSKANIRGHEDIGCHKQLISIEPTYRCERNISLSFDSSNDYKNLADYLGKNGWTLLPTLPTYGVNDGLTRFMYSKKENCISGFKAETTSSGYLGQTKLYVFITGPTQSKDTCVTATKS